MLYESDRHEPLTETPWNEAAARACMEAILREAVDRFAREGAWPAHPLDGFTAEDRDDLYLGAAGTLWALNHLASDAVFADVGDELAALNRSWLAHGNREHKPGLLTAGTGILLLRAKLDGIEHVSDDLAAQIDANSDSPALEIMWGSPGTMLASLWLHEWTGNDIWAERYRRDVGRLWERFGFVEEAGCHLWVQQLYGHEAPFMGAVHGFAGNAFAVLRGRYLLPPEEQSRWVERLGESFRATASREDDCANWPQSVGRHCPGRASWLVQHCHGAPGMVTCLADFPDSAIDDLLIAGAELVWRAGPLAKGSNLCHGTAGNGYAFLKLHVRTGDQRWLDRARRFAMHAIAQREHDMVLYGQARYPLWTGDLGLAVYLANCLAGTDRFPTMDNFVGS